MEPFLILPQGPLLLYVYFPMYVPWSLGNWHWGTYGGEFFAPSGAAAEKQRMAAHRRYVMLYSPSPYLPRASFPGTKENT